jgi:hypothetical protein
VARVAALDIAASQRDLILGGYADRVLAVRA